MVSSYHSISQRELLELREMGYTNMEIANRCGLSYVTVLKRIGRQPSPKERERLMDIATAPKPAFDASPKTDTSSWDNYMERRKNEKVLRKAALFHGNYFDFLVDSPFKAQVTLTPRRKLENLTTDDLDAIIKEINEIKDELKKEEN